MENGMLETSVLIFQYNEFYGFRNGQWPYIAAIYHFGLPQIYDFYSISFFLAHPKIWPEKFYQKAWVNQFLLIWLHWFILVSSACTCVRIKWRTSGHGEFSTLIITGKKWTKLLYESHEKWNNESPKKTLAQLQCTGAKDCRNTTAIYFQIGMQSRTVGSQRFYFRYCYRHWAAAFCVFQWWLIAFVKAQISSVNDKHNAVARGNYEGSNIR